MGYLFMFSTKKKTANVIVFESMRHTIIIFDSRLYLA